MKDTDVDTMNYNMKASKKNKYICSNMDFR